MRLHVALWNDKYDVHTIRMPQQITGRKIWEVVRERPEKQKLKCIHYQCRDVLEDDTLYPGKETFIVIYDDCHLREIFVEGMSDDKYEKLFKIAWGSSIPNIDHVTFDGESATIVEILGNKMVLKIIGSQTRRRFLLLELTPDGDFNVHASDDVDRFLVHPLTWIDNFEHYRKKARVLFEHYRPENAKQLLRKMTLSGLTKELFLTQYFQNIFERNSLLTIALTVLHDETDLRLRRLERIR